MRIKLLLLTLLTVTSMPNIVASDDAVADSIVAAEKAAEKAAKKAERRARIKEEWKAHFKFYGFVRNYLTYDSRQGFAASQGLYYFVPKDSKPNEYGQDLNATPEFRYLSITTRLGLFVTGYRYKQTHFAAKIEADFAFSVAGTAAVALRLRHAYFTMSWLDQPIAGGKKADLQLLMGQTWHPISTGYADIMSFETGSPFDLSNRSPQITFDATFDKRFTLTGSLLAQFQYSSTGPNGVSKEYQMNSLTPEAFMAFTYTHNGFVGRAGLNVLSIRPSKTGLDEKGVEVIVKDRIITFVPYLFLEYKYKDLVLSAKTAYGQAGEHINLMSGYGVSKINPDGSWQYTPMQSSSTWAYVQYGNKYIGSVFGGYFKNFGTIDPLVDTEHLFVNPNCSPGLTQAWRIIPSFKVHLGNFLFGVEYHYTAAQYGTDINNYGVATQNLHWVGNHRVLAMFQYAW